MVFFKTLISSALLLAGGAFARELTADDPHAPVINTSSAKCEVVAIGFSKVTNDKAIADTSADASAYICGGGDYHKSDSDIGYDVAKAFAIAIAQASVKCELEGDAHVHAKAAAHAKAEALVWVKAWASAFASSSVCGKCDAYAHSFGYIEKHVFLSAVADAEAKLHAYTSEGSGPLVLKVHDYMKDVEKVVAVAFAKAVAGAADYYKKHGCVAWVNIGGCIWTEDHGDQCFECEAKAVSLGAIKEIDALAKAGAGAASWTCGDHAVAIAEAEASAKAVARACAIALSYVWVGCESDGGFQCAAAGTWITETAHAVARAYAEIWAGAYNCKDSCNVNVDAVAKAVGDVLVKASTDAYKGICISGGSWSVDKLDVDIAKASVTAIAEASVAAISIGEHTCIAGGYVGAAVV